MTKQQQKREDLMNSIMGAVSLVKRPSKALRKVKDAAWNEIIELRSKRVQRPAIAA
jgi:hypothetical protein